ncbi:guanosine-diphosphatase [Cryptococcus bacillisporus CA1873]|uniref:guanosine-diphosphatase n=1 Tax=Cryptococcus bacillisporus CA1873 TaxID=1296111 RepID=A0ABR5B881_CRYGA|nr:guanosine-diphosphatase [Cryptococcus bacillisporus CA1873]|eukprot:KIR59802.1 guanosine-diphosphatase [Cryptococcus gattii CA1873]
MPAHSLTSSADTSLSPPIETSTSDSLPSLLSSLRHRPSGRISKTPTSPKSFASAMFSARKYTPLPTSANGPSRKRTAAGLTAWKRWALLATIAVALIFLVFGRSGGGSDEQIYNEENTYTPSLDEDIVEGDAIDYSSPPFRPEDSNVAQPLDHEDGDGDVLHALPVGDTSNPHDPTSNEAQDASEAEGDFTDVTDEESSSEEQSPYPGSFEEDPDPTSSTACTEPISSDKPLVQYALTIDAGSTGSRIHVYKFNNCGPSPQLEYETFMAVNPGLSAYARDPTAAAASLDPLLEEAYRVVPESLRKCTPVEVKATAGLRLLGQQESVAILDEVRNRLETNWDFTVSVYAWITANYLLNKIGEGADSDDTLAVMDLGGASTQIVFEPKFPADSDQALVEGEHKYELNFGGKDFTLYQHSYLGYGLMRARRSVHNLVAFTWSFGQGEVEWENLSEDIEVPNPCLSKGMTRRVALDPPGRPTVNVTMHGGNGNFEACNRVVELVMAKDAICEVKPCSFNGVYQPSLLDTFPRGQLLALSYFTDRIKPLHPSSSTLSISELTSMAKDVCAGPDAWADRWGSDPVAMEELAGRPEYCLDLTFMNALLGLGYELSPERELMVEKKLRGVELGWALGAGLALVEKAELTCTA